MSDARFDKLFAEFRVRSRASLDYSDASLRKSVEGLAAMMSTISVETTARLTICGFRRCRPLVPI
jgi:hypothetical protein